MTVPVNEVAATPPLTRKARLLGTLLLVLGVIDLMQLVGLGALFAYVIAGTVQVQPGSALFNNLLLLLLIFAGLAAMAFVARSWLRSSDAKVMTPITFAVHLVAFPLGSLVAVAGLLVLLLMPNAHPGPVEETPATTRL